MSPNAYTELTRLCVENPDLLFYNNGYQELPDEVKEKNRVAILEIESILRENVRGFVRFQNFKPRKDGSTAVRYQAEYGGGVHFVGVVYTPMEDFLPTPEGDNHVT